MRPNIWVFCRTQLASSVAVIAMSNQFVAIKIDTTALVFLHAKINYILRRSYCKIW